MTVQQSLCLQVEVRCIFKVIHVESKHLKTGLGRTSDPQQNHLYRGGPSSQPATTWREETGVRKASHDQQYKTVKCKTQTHWEHVLYSLLKQYY